MKHIDFIRNSNKLSDIARYPTVYRIKHETVAEHLAQTAIIVLALHEEYEFDLCKALAMAVLHDIPETEINDSPHTVKKAHPDLAKALKDAEMKVIETYPTKIRSTLMSYHLDSSIEHDIVELADAMSCYIYSESEVNLGNQYMKRVMIESKERIDLLEKHLKEAK